MVWLVMTLFMVALATMCWTVVMVMTSFMATTAMTASWGVQGMTICMAEPVTTRWTAGPTMIACNFLLKQAVLWLTCWLARPLAPALAQMWFLALKTFLAANTQTPWWADLAATTWMLRTATMSSPAVTATTCSEGAGVPTPWPV